MWFVDLDKGAISSFAKLVETFCSCWDLDRHEKWMRHVEHGRKLFSKEIQNEYQAEEAIIQDLIDDISSTVPKDEVPHVEEYDCGPTYED